ncbi:MAG: SPOR domain-containing protein [Candidatus Marinimicrobia bacterium]|nr:SPOR domain-containing protein [Candidatus Neomarinimicrobiota bacterium]
MIIQTLNKLFLVTLASFFLLIAQACGEKGEEGIVGSFHTINANHPEENGSFDFQWSIIAQPDASNLSKKNLIFNTDNSVMTFIPDVEGNYIFQVSISQYNDELSVQSFPFNISANLIAEDQENGDQVIEVASSSNDIDAWLQEKIEQEDKSVIESPPPPPSLPVKKIRQKPVLKKSKPKRQQIKNTSTKKSKSGPAASFNKKRFTVQIGSKQSFNEAKAIASEFIEIGYDAYIEKSFIKMKNQFWYRVRVGSYYNYDTAVSLATTISTTKNVPTWVDNVRNE